MDPNCTRCLSSVSAAGQLNVRPFVFSVFGDFDSLSFGKFVLAPTTDENKTSEAWYAPYGAVRYWLRSRYEDIVLSIALILFRASVSVIAERRKKLQLIQHLSVVVSDI